MRTAIRLYKMDLLPGLIEEVQTLVNRMEAKLQDYANMGYEIDRYRELKIKVNRYKEKVENLEELMEDAANDFTEVEGFVPVKQDQENADTYEEVMSPTKT